MLGLVGVISFIVILLIVIVFFIFNAVDFIDPTPIQIQLFGIHVTLIGGILLISTFIGTGFLTMMLGLALGVYGSFKSSDSGHEAEQAK
ncbi:hypothetical protein [Alkalibacillus haloalkaliphilus]|uniref:Uncharacterized protein n=1 Tax=Alkalibacillus haloalkaliphilus TaxID=94136 RepID=A0A511W679_9BACI|nr:hypothetical protein [Alkalibacillus haloalkaliphilus]GEN45563.1 hypothetical protein AHA02nite_13390 [Alkalibacillus haloalkaliphilus]